jgi:hypothetical protein
MTPGLQKRMAEHPFDELAMARIMGGIPFNRVGLPEEIAGPNRSDLYYLYINRLVIIVEI